MVKPRSKKDGEFSDRAGSRVTGSGRHGISADDLLFYSSAYFRRAFLRIEVDMDHAEPAAIS